MLQILKQSPIMPVVIIDDAECAVPLAKAIYAGGIKAIEITLRTPAALESIKRIAHEVPEIQVGAGTILKPEQFAQVKAAGAIFGVSPGLLPSLVAAAKEMNMPYLPGAVTASEVMHALSLGITAAKFFPAELMGGVKTIAQLNSVFPQFKFCVTGGLTKDNMNNYLALDAVAAVGGTWLTPKDLIQQKNWPAITQLVKEAIAHKNSSR